METLRILVVDDEPAMRSGVVRALHNFGLHLDEIGVDIVFTIDEAGSAEQAMEMLEATPTDIMLLDYKLPNKSGLEVLEWVDGKGLDLLTVMITAYASIETAVTATKRGAYDFLPKPFTPSELKATVGKAARQLILQRHARKLTEEKRQVRFQFISVLAHELKAPLAAVTGYLYLMRDKALGDELEAYQSSVERSLVRLDGMRKMILDLLDLTRIESGQKKRELVDVDLVEVARCAMETMTPDAGVRRITLNLNCPAQVPLVADRGEMEIILNNLVSNAVKYNRDGGRVDISITTDGGAVTVTVSDTGIGMTQEEAQRLFGEFVRIKNAKTRTIMGSGLGLSIVKKLATLYHGSVGVESTPDVGTTFTVTLRG